MAKKSNLFSLSSDESRMIQNIFRRFASELPGMGIWEMMELIISLGQNSDLGKSIARGLWANQGRAPRGFYFWKNPNF